MVRKTMTTKKAPGWPGISQAIQAGDFLFLSGQTGVYPDTGKMADGISEQTRQALENMKAILQEAGMSLKDVVKVLVFVNQMADYDGMNKVYATYFKEGPPVRATVEAKLSSGCLVEFDAVAYAKL